MTCTSGASLLTPYGWVLLLLLLHTLIAHPTPGILSFIPPPILANAKKIVKVYRPGSCYDYSWTGGWTSANSLAS